MVSVKDRANAERLLTAAKSWLAFVPDHQRALALADVAAAVTKWDPEEASRLLTDARAVEKTLRRARSGTDRESETRQNIAVALAKLDPDSAADFAHTIRDPRRQGACLDAVVRETAAKNLDRAEGLARAISSPDYQARALARVEVARANAERPWKAR